MEAQMSQEQHVQSARRQVVGIARAMLAHEINFLLGARRLASLWHQTGVQDNDSDFATFTSIDSETDDLPLGDMRQQWDAQALAKLQPDIDAAEEWARDFGELACLALIKRFEED